MDIEYRVIFYVFSESEILWVRLIRQHVLLVLRVLLTKHRYPTLVLNSSQHEYTPQIDRGTRKKIGSHVVNNTPRFIC